MPENINSIVKYINALNCHLSKKFAKSLNTLSVVYIQGELVLEKLVSPDYEEAFRDCALDGAFSSAWTIQAAVTVLQREIVSIYPALNGILDKCVSILNTTFQPRTKPTGRPVYIMWSSTYYPKPKKSWTPNHFVPLLIDPDKVCTQLFVKVYVQIIYPKKMP